MLTFSLVASSTLGFHLHAIDDGTLLVSEGSVLWRATPNGLVDKQAIEGVSAISRAGGTWPDALWVAVPSSEWEMMETPNGPRPVRPLERCLAWSPAERRWRPRPLVEPPAPEEQTVTRGSTTYVCGKTFAFVKSGDPDWRDLPPPNVVPTALDVIASGTLILHSENPLALHSFDHGAWHPIALPFVPAATVGGAFKGGAYADVYVARIAASRDGGVWLVGMSRYHPQEWVLCRAL